MKLYIFIGMFDGINERVEPYVSKVDAEKAWFDHAEIEYADFEKDRTILDYSKYSGSFIYVEDFPIECYDPTRKIAITWDIDDVKNVRPDLSDEQSMQVLEQVRDKHDAEMGVSWTTLEEWARILLPLPSDESQNKRLIDTAVRLYNVNSSIIDDYTVHDALCEASKIYGVNDLHNDEDDERYGEYEKLVTEVEKQLGFAG